MALPADCDRLLAELNYTDLSYDACLIEACEGGFTTFKFAPLMLLALTQMARRCADWLGPVVCGMSVRSHVHGAKAFLHLLLLGRLCVSLS